MCALFILNFGTLAYFISYLLHTLLHSLLHRFVIRALFIANFGTLCLLILAASCSSAYIILVFERPYPHVDQV